MNDKIIEFSAEEEILHDEEIRPIPAKKFIPEWYKNLDIGNNFKNQNIKNCIPFLDALCAGYILKSPQDFEVNFNVSNPNLQGEKDTWVEVRNNHFTNYNINNRNHYECHTLAQVGGTECPFAKTNKNFSFYKIMNPWLIKVPVGYSLLFIPPINREDERFEIISGIVDYTYGVNYINFPIVFKKEGSWVLKKGTPIATVFPFKLDNWQATFSIINKKERNNFLFKFNTKMWNFYKNFLRIKKKWN